MPSNTFYNLFINGRSPPLLRNGGLLDVVNFAMAGYEIAETAKGQVVTHHCDSGQGWAAQGRKIMGQRFEFF
jgi:hypothetical protein